MEKRLYRSRENRVIFGIAGGLGEYFGYDPVLVRVILVILSLMGGPGIILYIVLALVIPEAPAGKNKNDFTDSV